jgi:hypothetical protein
MKIAYLILAHKNPKLIKRMTEFLSCEDFAYFIHIDRKSNLNDFSLINGENICFSDQRIPVYWAEYSMVEAILVLIHRALAAPQKYDYYILLSGSDYPLRSKEYIHNFFNINQGKEYISIKKIPDRDAGLSLSKINTLRIPSNKPILRFIVRILAKLGLAERDYKKYLGTLEPYGGSTWWGLTRDACEYIIDFVKNNQSICKFYEKTFSSDEMIFHTILGNSLFKPRIHRTFMYDDWSKRGAHPALIGEKQIKYFKENKKIIFDDVFGPGEMLFARKFSDDNIEIAQEIENIIKQKDNSSNG